MTTQRRGTQKGVKTKGEKAPEKRLVVFCGNENIPSGGWWALAGGGWVLQAVRFQVRTARSTRRGSDCWLSSTHAGDPVVVDHLPPPATTAICALDPLF